jgi:LPXTG-site transpeptidase (sortase) family protein
MRRVRIPTFLFSLFLSSTLVVIAALPALGYIPRPVTRVFISTPPKVVRCDQNLKIEATLRDVKTGRPVAGQPVIFRLVERQHPGDKFLVTKRRSQKDGYVASVFHFGNKAGQRRISVSIPNSKPVANIRCAGGLAKASIMPPEDFVEQVPNAFYETPIEPPPPADTLQALPATNLRMRRLGIDVPIVHGNGWDAPEDAVAHYPDTAWPGEGSNMYVYGHAREGIFLELWDVRTGDLVEVDMADGTVAEYEVSEIHPIVQYDAFEYLEDTDREIITLQTCLDYAETSPRFVVIAERIPSA